MSKFEELCKIYDSARGSYVDYQRVCHDFASRLVKSMIDYFQGPEGAVTFIPLQGEPEPEKTYTLMGAMHLDKDTFWHLGVVVTLYPRPGIFLPHRRNLLCFLIKKVEDYFIVKLSHLKEEFKIHRDKPDEFNPFFEFVFEKIKESYENSLQRFLEQDSIFRIGFHS